MMTCSEIENRLILLYYKELSSSEVLDLEKHIGICEKCAQALGGLKTLLNGIDKNEEIPLPVSMGKAFSHGIKKRIHGQKDETDVGWWSWIRVHSAPVFAVLVLVGFVTLSVFLKETNIPDNRLASLSILQEMEMFRNLEFYEEVELLEEMELLTNWENNIAGQETG